MRNIIFVLVLLTAGIAVSFTITNETVNNDTGSNVNWMTWEEAIEANKTDKRKFFVDVYTDWCGWCKRMDKATFQQPHIAKYLNENFYSVKFNAESKSPITINGKEYKYVSQGRRGYHQLAAKIMKGKMSYPTVVFMNEEIKVIQPIPGFRKADEFEQIMTYFASNSYNNVPWPKYQKSYKPLDKQAN